MRATLAIATIQLKLAELDQAQARDPVSSGLRAALWRAQHEAARRGRGLEDLRAYCLEALRRSRLLDAEDENDYLRGYRQGLRLVLGEIRRIETGPARG